MDSVWGEQYKTAFNYYLGNYENTIGIIQCDADGQHHIDDICKCAELLSENPQCFILGQRDFCKSGIPFRSRFGNKCTSIVFKLFCGMDIKDTQTGLKGIPRDVVRYLIESDGERYEYASSVLLEIRKRGVSIKSFDIQTIYIDENESSHFRPLIDSARIYSLILRYSVSSLMAFFLDIMLYSLFINIFRSIVPDAYIMISTYLSRCISCIYTFVFNKKIVFCNTGELFSTAVRFFTLCIVQASLSGALVNMAVSVSGSNEILFKIIVDTLLFFVSFQIQSRWVFRN